MPKKKKSSKAAQHTPTPLSPPDEKSEINPGQPINFPEFAEKTYEHQTMLYDKINKLEKHIKEKESERQDALFSYKVYMADMEQMEHIQT